MFYYYYYMLTDISIIYTIDFLGKICVLLHISRHNIHMHIKKSPILLNDMRTNSLVNVSVTIIHINRACSVYKVKSSENIDTTYIATILHDAWFPAPVLRQRPLNITKWGVFRNNNMTNKNITITSDIIIQRFLTGWI